MDLGASKGLVASGDFLYWSSIDDAGEGEIMRLRVRPQVGVPERIAPFHLPLIPGIAADDSGVWWLDTTLGLATSDGDGGERAVLDAAVVPTGAFPPIARYGGTIHFAAMDHVVSFADDGGLTSTTLPGVLALAADDSGLYAAHDIVGGVEIGQLTIAGKLSVWDKTANLQTLASDGDALYIADSVAREIRKTPRYGSPSVLVKTAAAPVALAIAGQFVFYAVASPKGAVHRVPK